MACLQPPPPGLPREDTGTQASASSRHQTQDLSTLLGQDCVWRAGLFL